MNLKTVATAVTNKLGRPILVTQKHSPTILFGVGVVGVVATVVLASRATLKLDEVLEKTQDDLERANFAHENVTAGYSDQDYQRDTLVIYAKATGKIIKLYGPAVLVGLASIGALSGSHVILNRRNAGLAAAYGALDKGFKEYRKRVVGEFGEEADARLKFETEDHVIVQETDEGPVTKVIKRITKDGQSIYARAFDEFSTSWSPERGYNVMFVRCQQMYANDLLKSRGHVFLNEVYDMLGLARSKEGAVVGWVRNDDNGDNYIDFGVFDGDMFSATRFINGVEESVWLDFNVDGVIYDKI